MTSDTLKLPKQLFGFFSITIAWFVTMVIYTLYQVILYGSARDAAPIITWSAMFGYTAWAVFIIFPLAVLNHSRKIFRITILPLVTGIYAAAVYTLLIWFVFQSAGLIVMFLAWAIIIGILFGASYTMLIASTKLRMLLQEKPLLKLFPVLSPLILAGTFWWLFPTVFPAAAFRFMPAQIRDKIVIRTMPHFKKGDSFSGLQKALPGYFDGPGVMGIGDAIVNGNGGVSHYGESFEFQLQVKNDTIEQLDTHIK